MALCEAAAYYKTQGKTLWDAMVDMYDKYGYYKARLEVTIVLIRYPSSGRPFNALR